MTLNTPSHMVVDGLGSLLVADTVNNRILKFSAPITNGIAPTVVLGQPDFFTNTVNNPTVGAHTLNSPFALATDAQNNIYAADSLNNRVLRYDFPINTTYISASLVLGQPDFTSTAPNGGGSAGAATLYRPRGVATGADGSLYVSDSLNNRVLQNAASLVNGMAAARVIGQSNFTNTSNGTSATQFWFPYGIALDRFGSLYVADTTNNRVRQYYGTITTGMPASRVFGQPNFNSNTVNYPSGAPTASNFHLPYGVAADLSTHLYTVENNNHRVLGFDLPATRTFFPLITR